MLKKFDEYVNENVDSEKNKKNAFWEEHWEELIELVNTSWNHYENWVALLDGDEEQADGIHNSTAKHQAQALLHILSIEDLERELEELKNMNSCDHCLGEGGFEDEACPECGKFNK